MSFTVLQELNEFWSLLLVEAMVKTRNIYQTADTYKKRWFYWGLVNIYGNVGPGYLQWDHGLFWSFSWIGPPVILRIGSTGPRLISVSDFNRAKDYFEVLRYGFLVFPGHFHIKNTGPEQIYTTGLTFFLEGDFNGTVKNLWPSGYGALYYFV